MDFNIENNPFKQQKIDANQSLRRQNPVVATIIAKVVSARRYENNEFVGKYGFALAGDTKLNFYQLLLYGSKSSVLENLIVTKDLHRDFKYIVNENLKIGFLANEKWILEFSNLEDANEFNSHLSFVLWKLNGPKELFWMDLSYPTRNEKVATFDSVIEITYHANTVKGKIYGPEVSNNVNDDRHLKVNVSKEGWERSLLGVNVDTYRIVYIPIAEMGAWKILTEGQHCLCLTVNVKNLYEIKENSSIDLPVLGQETLNSSIIQSREIVDDNILIKTDTRTICIESLYEEFENLKKDNIKTHERLSKLEALINERRSETIDNSCESEFKTSIKTMYKNIVRVFPTDQTFSGSEIQLTIKDIFCDALKSFNQSQIRNNSCK